jgi:hypothetical protein
VELDFRLVRRNDTLQPGVLGFTLFHPTYVYHIHNKHKIMVAIAKPLTQRPYQVPLTEIASMAIEALWSNKLRSGLTMLGVIIGIASVISISSIGQGVQKSTEESIRGLGTDVLQVMAGSAQSGGISQGQGSVTTLTWEDAQALEKQAPSATVVAAYLQRNTQVVYGDKNTATTVYGADLNYPKARIRRFCSCDWPHCTEEFIPC